MKRTFLLLLCGFLVCCSSPGNDADADSPVDAVVDSTDDEENWKKYEQSLVLANYTLASIPSGDVLVIDSSAAVFVSPDSLQIERMHAEMGDDFYTVADDNLYYEYEAAEFLKRKDVQVLYPKERYLKFVTFNGNPINFDTKAEAGRGWTALLFRPDSLPRIINPVDIETEFEAYFGR